MKPLHPKIAILIGFLLLQSVSCDKQGSEYQYQQYKSANGITENVEEFKSKVNNILENSKKGSYLTGELGNIVTNWKSEGYEIEYAYAADTNMLGTIQWKGRTLDAGITRLTYALINRVKGEKHDINMIFAGAYDREFNIWREVLILVRETHFETDIKNWKLETSFVETNKIPTAVYYFGGQVR